MAEKPDLDAIKQTIESLAINAAAPERVEAGPGTVEPTTATKDNNPLMPVPMPPGDVEKWWERIKRSRARRDKKIEEWDILLKEYLPNVTKGGTPEAVKYNGHFRNVHSKLPQLFFQVPDLILTPRDPSPLRQTIPNPMAQLIPGTPPMLKMEDIVSIKQAVLGDKLGREGIKAERLMDELLFDVLAWSGIAACKIGYLCVQKPFKKPVMQPDPTFQTPTMGLGLSGASQPPMVPVMGADGQPQTTDELATIYQDWFARRFSPKKLLLPDDLYSSRYEEDATWKGMDFFMSPERAKKVLKITDEDVNKCVGDDLRAKYEDDVTEGNQGLVHGVEIFLKSSYYTDELHPKAFHQLILLEGIMDRAIVWRPCPDQTFDPATGKLTPDSIDRNPIQVLGIRDLADSPFPKSDSAYSNTNVKEIGTFRRQSVLLRDAAIGKYFYDMDAFDKDDVKNMKNAEVGDYIGVESGKLDKGADKILARTPQLQGTNDDYRTAVQLKTDMDEVLGIGQSFGQVNDTVHSATEIRDATSGSAARNKKEQGRVLDFYLDLARHVDQLVMRYATEDDYTLIAGPDGAKTIQMWNSKMVSGRYLYEVSPDSQLQIDTERDWLFALNFYNQVAKDPLVNRSYVLRRLARMRRFDPNQVVMPNPPQPMPKPDVPSISFAFKPEDILIGTMPGANPQQIQLSQYLLLILEKATQTTPPPTGQPPHGGGGAVGEAINQHSASNSGGQPNAPGAINHRAEMVK
jgi:hypothetical protein